MKESKKAFILTKKDLERAWHISNGIKDGDTVDMHRYGFLDNQGDHEEISTVGLTTYRINEDIGWEKMEAMSLGTHR